MSRILKSCATNGNPSLPREEVSRRIRVAWGLLLVLTFCSPPSLWAQTTNGELFYSISANTTPRTRDYSDASNTFGAATTTVAGNTAIQSVLRASPTKNEMIAGYVNASGVLQVMCFNGTSWSNEWSLTVGGTGSTRRFDIAYETNSGDVVVLYSRNVATTNELGYRTKSGGSGCGTANWSAATNVDPTVTSGVVHWVTLAWDRRASSNLITAIWADANRDLGAVVWSGSAWGTQKQLETSLQIGTAAQDVEDFDVEYESLSGDVLVVWGNSAGANGTNGVRYATCPGGTATCTWSAVSTPPTFLDDATHLDISANPTTDELIFASIGKAGADLQIGYWSGSAWTNTANVDTTATTPTAGTKFVATGWLINGSTTRSIVVYYDASATNVGWYVGNGATFTAQTDFAPTPVFGTQKQYGIQMDPFSKDRLMLLVSDGNSDIFAKRLVMSATGTFTWSNADGGAALEVNTASTTYKTSDFAFTRFDVQPPSAPSNLSATAVSSSRIDLAWGASTDNVGVTGYRVERCQGAGCSNFAEIATPANSPLSDTGLTPATPYSYQVRATDAAGNLSNYSSVASATTMAAPVINDLFPTIGAVGTAVTISGSGFGVTQGSSTVTFSTGVAATPSSWSDTSIGVTVPAGASTGQVVVTVNGFASNGVTFTVSPNITNLSPTSGAVGTAVIISGTSFGATQGGSTVTFNGVTATPSNWSDTSVTAAVPTGAATGPVVITVGGVASNGVTFTLPPMIGSLSPAAGHVATSVRIVGSGFGATQGTSTVTFNGLAATPTSWTSTTIVVPVPNGATTGDVVVTVGGLASNGVTFTMNNVIDLISLYDESGRLAGVVDPVGESVIYSYDVAGNLLGIARQSSSTVAIIVIKPKTGAVGASVTILGTAFSPVPSENIVTFNGVAASVLSSSSTQIVTTVPAGATTGPIAVTNGNGSATSSIPFTVTTP